MGVTSVASHRSHFVAVKKDAALRDAVKLMAEKKLHRFVFDKMEGKIPLPDNALFLPQACGGG